MNLEQRKKAFIESGLFIERHFNNNWIPNEKGLHEGLNHLMDVAFTYNGWFVKQFVELALKNIGVMLNEKTLNSFTKNIPEPKQTKTVAIIMAGNIPMVGFHDLLCVVLCGHKALVKLSADDNVLLPFFIKLLDHYVPGIGAYVSYAENKLADFDAVIATGSNNTASYFEYYFGKYPHIIRKNRTSLAVLNGKESTDDLKNLGADVFTYFGLGCRNVSKLIYNRAIYLLNTDKFLDNNFLIIKQDQGLHSPVSVLFYQEYDSGKDLNAYLDEKKTEIQCIIGKNPAFVPFGYSQQPVITEYADGINTVNFLLLL